MIRATLVAALARVDDPGDALDGMAYASVPEVGVELDHAVEDVVSAAEDALGTFRDEAGDGWSEEVNRVEWGVALPVMRAQMVNVVDTPDGPFDYQCDYVLRPVAEPATDTVEPNPEMEHLRRELARAEDGYTRLMAEREEWRGWAARERAEAEAERDGEIGAKTEATLRQYGRTDPTVQMALRLLQQGHTADEVIAALVASMATSVRTLCGRVVELELHPPVVIKTTVGTFAEPPARSEAPGGVLDVAGRCAPAWLAWTQYLAASRSLGLTLDRLAWKRHIHVGGHDGTNAMLYLLNDYQRRDMWMGAVAYWRSEFNRLAARSQLGW